MSGELVEIQLASFWLPCGRGKRRVSIELAGEEDAVNGGVERGLFANFLGVSSGCDSITGK